MKDFIVNARFSRRVPDPVFGASAQRHIFLVPAELLPPGLPMDPNPRDQNVDKLVWREIRRHLLNKEGTPNTFHLKNKGITLVASEVEKLDEDRFRLAFDEGDGVLDGGHTYKLIVESQEDLVRSLEDDDAEPITQYVKLEILTGLDRNLAAEIAGGLNTALQVQKFSLANLEGQFEWIKQALANQPYADAIAYRENEKKKVDVRDLVVLMDMFNLSAFPNDGSDQPSRAYHSKSGVLDHYLKHTDQYKALAGILPQILELHDRIDSEACELHNRAGGNAGHLAFVSRKKRGKHRFLFIGEEAEQRLERAARYPMIAAFRWMATQDASTGEVTWDGGFSAVLQVWRAVAPELMRATKSTSDDFGRKTAAIGRSKNHWTNLHNIVAKHHLMAMRKR